MDFQELETDSLGKAPPVMPWAKFAEWIQMGDDVLVVQNWLNRGYILTLRIGKHLKLNVERFRQRLLGIAVDALSTMGELKRKSP